MSLTPPNVLSQGSSIKSPNGEWVLIMQNDGNLVGYHGQDVFFNSDTAGKGSGPYTAALSPDGMLAVRDGRKQVLWKSVQPSVFFKPIKLTLNDTGSLNIVDSTGKSVWRGA